MSRNLGSVGEWLAVIGLVIAIPFMAFVWVIYSLVNRQDYRTEWNKPED